jgi:hypothetical protein
MSTPRTSPTRGQLSDPPAGQATAPHALTCVWFWAWAAVGALAILSLDLGPLTALPALLLGVLLATLGDRRQGSVSGFTTGAGLPLLWVAYVQRQGPGTTCWHTATSTGCEQHLNPLPWLIVGITLVLAGLIEQTRRNR